MELSHIEIPESVTQIGVCVFQLCDSLTSIIISKDNQYYYSDGNCVITKQSHVLIAGCRNSIIPFGVVEIGARAFEGCECPAEIVIPNGVIRIEELAFNASGLQCIDIPQSVSFFGFNAFAGCTALVTIRLRQRDPSAVENIDYSLDWVDLSSITLYVPIGTGYAYRHHPYFSRFKEIIPLL